MAGRIVTRVARDDRGVRRLLYVAGERVFVADEASEGTVVRDDGYFQHRDQGVTVRIDSDGEKVACAHDQLRSLGTLRPEDSR